MVFAFDGKDPLPVLGQDVYLVRDRFAANHHPYGYLVAFFQEKVAHEALERITGIAQLAQGVLQAVAHRRPSGIFPQQGEGLAVDFLGGDPVVGFQFDRPDDDLGHFVRRPDIFERTVYFFRIENRRFARFFYDCIGNVPVDPPEFNR